MPLPNVPDHYYVAATFQSVSGEVSINTFTFRNESPTTSPEAAASSLRDLLDEFYGTGLAVAGTVGGLLSLTLFGLTYVIYDLGDPEGGGWELPSLTFRDTAGGTAQGAPPDLAICMSWTTAKRGRSFRGRTYLGPLAVDVIDNSGRPSASDREQIAEAGSKLIGAPLTRAWQLAILSRTRELATPVTGGYVDDAFDVQRRRDSGPTARTPIVAP